MENVVHVHPGDSASHAHSPSLSTTKEHVVPVSTPRTIPHSPTPLQDTITPQTLLGNEGGVDTAAIDTAGVDTA